MAVEKSFKPSDYYNPADSGDWTVVNERPSHVDVIHSAKAMENLNAIYGPYNWSLHHDRNARLGYLVVKTSILDQQNKTE